MAGVKGVPGLQPAAGRQLEPGEVGVYRPGGGLGEGVVGGVATEAVHLHLGAVAGHDQGVLGRGEGEEQEEQEHPGQLVHVV